MAQYVEKLPSENTPARPVADQPVTFDVGISDYFQRLCSAFLINPRTKELNSEEAFSESLYRGLMLGLFGMLNYIASKLIVNMEYFASINPQLNRFCSILFAALSLPLAYFALQNNFSASINALKKKMLSASVCQSLAVIIAAAYLTYLLVADTNLLIKSGAERNFIFLVFLLSLANFLEASFFRQVMLRTGFDMSMLAQELKTAGSEDNRSSNIHFNQVKIGDVLEAGNGELIAFDGIVIDGQAQVLETIFCAKGSAGMVQASDKVFGGSTVIRGRIVYKVTALNQDTALSDFSSVINRRLIENSSEQVQSFNSNQTICNMLCMFFAVTAGLFWLARFQSIHTAVSVACSILLISLTAKLMQLMLLMPVFTDTAAFYRGVLFVKSLPLKTISALRRLVVDYNINDRAEVVKLIKFDLIDKRVDEETLPSVLFTLAGRGSGPESQAITNYITDKSYEISLYDNQDYIEYFDTNNNSARGFARGFVGKVSGVDFTAGNEDFLLERGVLVQASEIDDSENLKPGQYYWYLALQREVIAYLMFSKDDPSEVQLELNKLRSEGFRATLCSRDDNKIVDQAAQSLGFELADIYGGLNEDNYSKKLESLKPCAFYYSSDMPENLKSKADLTISVFDELQYDLRKSDILIFDQEFRKIFDSVLIPVRSQRIERQNFLLATSLSLLLLGLSVMNLISPIICLIAVMSASTAMLLNVLRLGKF